MQSSKTGDIRGWGIFNRFLILPGLFGILLVTGCSTSTRPLRVVPEVKTPGVRVLALAGETRPVYTTVTGRSARMVGFSGGAIGAIIGSSVAAASESGGDKVVDELRDKTGRMEPQW